MRFALTGAGIFPNRGRIEHPFCFVGADPAFDPAMVATRCDRRAFLGRTSFLVVGNDRLKLDVGYRGEFGNSVTSHSANVDLKLAF
jgi:hypothetical protein